MAHRDRRSNLLLLACIVTALLACPARALIVTEVMFHPVETGGTPDGPENLEYIELYNDRAVTEDIGGFAFTTGIHYTFPASAKIPPKTYIVVAKDPAALQAAYGITGVYGPFTGSLDNDGERVTLSNANGGIALTIRYSDGHPWYPAADGTGHSLTRVKFAGDPEEASSWAPSVYIGGTPAAPEVAAPQARLCINELLTNSESGSGQDWIEIYNPGPVPVDMSTVYLSDARFSLINEYKFPDGLVLQPGAFISVDQAALGFGLSSAGGETVFLTQSTGGQKPRPLRVLDAVRFATVEADVTIGRSPDGGGKIVALSTPTRNAANAAPLQRPIVINEIMYQHGSRDPRYEFVELYNRSGSNRAPVPGDNLPLRLDFNPDQRFRLRTEMNLDGTEGSLRGPLQERAAYWFYRKMGLQYSTQEYIWPILNGATHHTYENVQKIDGDYIDAWFPEDSDGALHKIDDYFEYNFNGTNFKNLDEGLIHDAAHPLIKETYRWSFEKRSHRENDDWSALLRLAEMLNTPPTDPQYETNIESVIDPHAFIMALAIRRAIGDWDSYGFLRGKNYCLYYAPNADRWSLIPWDIDYGFGSGAGATTIIYGVAPWFPEIDAMLQYPKYKRIYEQCLSQLVNGPWRTSWGTAGPPTEFDRFLDDAANARIADGMADQPFIDRWNAIKAFVAERRSYILEQLPSGHLEITTNNGLDFCAPQGQTILRGVAPPEVSQITLNGVPVPAAFSANNVFSINVTVALGPNVYNLQGLDAAGLAVPGAADSIAITGVPLASITSVEPAAVCTGRTAELTIHGSGFEPGSATQLALAAYSDEIGFDAMYVKASLAIDHINTASAFLDDPDAGFGDPVRAVHTAVNLYSAGSSGIFVPNDPFAAPYNTGIQDFAIRFTGWLVVPSPGLRHLGVNSDDGFRLSIDLNDDGDWTDSGETIGEHPTARTPATTMMSVNFPAARRYYLVLDYFQRDGAAEIEFFQAANAAGQAPRLINTDSELVVLRDDTRVISATDVRVTGTHTITCRADFTDAPPAFWDIVVTPACGPAKARARSVFRTSLCPNDLNRDGRIDAADLRIIADLWLNPCTAPDWCAGADLDHSQRVDLADLAALAAYWN